MLYLFKKWKDLDLWNKEIDRMAIETGNLNEYRNRNIPKKILDRKKHGNRSCCHKNESCPQ